MHSTAGMAKCVIFAIPLAALIYVISYKSWFGIRDSTYLQAASEDGVIEYFTALFLFLAVALSARGALISLRRGLWVTGAFSVTLCAAMLFVGLEEISYGQRILGFSTPPELERINRQREFGIHNISTIEWFTLRIAPVIVSAYGIFGGFLGILLKRLPVIRPVVGQRLDLIFPPWYGVSYFVPLAIYSYTIFYSGDDFVWQDQEPAELFMAIGLMIVAARLMGGVRDLPKSYANAGGD